MAVDKNLLLSPGRTLRCALEALTENRMKIVLVTDDAGRLLGTITDGDVRRALLRGADLEHEVGGVMNARPWKSRRDVTSSEINDLMRRHSLVHMPIVDDDDVLIDLRVLNAPPRLGLESTPVLLMAGGEGRRLRPLTENTPKPMLELGGKPILERIIERLAGQGFRTFYISLNYLGHVIQDYFGNGEFLDVSIYYLHEEKKLGTGGALSLLPPDVSDPVIVMNGDLLTDLNFADLVQTHLDGDYAATMCTREHMTTLPFGVVDAENSKFRDIVEKPNIVHNVNAGIYCLSSRVLDHLTPNSHYDMPDIFKMISGKGNTCGVHSVTGQWIDIGTHHEFERADALFGQGSVELEEFA